MDSEARQPNEIVAIQVRMPERVRLKVALSAAKNRRSLNAEIVWRLDHTDEDLVETFNQLRALAEPDQAEPDLLTHGSAARVVPAAMPSPVQDWREFLINAGPEFIEMLAELVADRLKKETKE
jgi:hypothetical protein